MSVFLHYMEVLDVFPTTIVVKSQHQLFLHLISSSKREREGTLLAKGVVARVFIVGSKILCV